MSKQWKSHACSLIILKPRRLWTQCRSGCDMIWSVVTPNRILWLCISRRAQTWLRQSITNFSQDERAERTLRFISFNFLSELSGWQIYFGSKLFQDFSESSLKIQILESQNDEEQNSNDLNERILHYKDWKLVHNIAKNLLCVNFQWIEQEETTWSYLIPSLD